VRAFGISILVLAVLAAVIAYTNNCSYEGRSLTLANGRQVPMKCYWTAQAEIATAAPVFVLGAIMAISRRRESPRSLAIVGAILGVSMMALPVALIGVCSDMTASCNLIMRPAMLLIGGLVILASAGTLVVAERRREAYAGLGGARS